MTDGEDSSSDRPKISLLNRSQGLRHALGVLFLVFVISGGRIIRNQMLIGPEGQWRQELWLDSLLVENSLAAEEKPPPKPVLTTPLPINSCSQDSLTLLPGVGPVLAKRIMGVRNAGTVFRSVLDLKQVKGIGPALSARLEPLVIFELDEGHPAEKDSLPDRDQLPAISR